MHTCMRVCMQQLCISVLGITPGYDEHWTQCSCFCLLWGRGTYYWEVRAVKLWLHSQRAYIFISVLVGVTWYLIKGNLKEGRSIVAHGWRGRSMMDTPSHNYGNSSCSLLCLYLLESRSKERARGQKLAGLYNPQGLPPSESLIPAGPPCSEDDTTSWKGTASRGSIVRYEPVGGISYPTPQIRACVLVARLHSPAPALWILGRKRTHYKISSNVLKVQCDEHALVQMCTRLCLSNAESRLSLIISRKHLLYLGPESL